MRRRRWGRRAGKTSGVLVIALIALSSSGGLAVGANDQNKAQEQNKAAVTGTAWPGARWSPPKASFGATVVSGVAVKMSDGVVLKVDVSYPTDLDTGQRAKGKFPVLLTQTPYLGTSPKAGDYFVQRGYIYVTAHVRGTTVSGGAFGFFGDRDAKDGAELVEWAAKTLEGSNGTIGLDGDSYAGINQMFTVAEIGPDSPIKAASASCMGAEFYRETYFASGVPTQTLNFQRVIGGAMGGDTAAAGAAIVADVEAGGEKSRFTEFWKERTVGDLAEEIVDADVPTLLWSSEGDIYAQSSLELYSYLQNAHASKPVHGPMDRSVDPTGRYQIVMSQGPHCGNQDPGVQLQWFEEWLKGVDTGIDDTSMPIHVKESISDQWINTSHYPAVDTYSPYYMGFGDGGSLATTTATADSREIAWSAPADGAKLQFESPVFPRGATLAGPISATIHASSTTTDLMLIGKLEVVHSDKSVTKLTSGTVLGSMSELDDERNWRDSAGILTRPYGKYDRSVPLEPGRISKLDFTLSPRFAALPPGSKLRLVLSTQTDANCKPVLGTDPCFPTDVHRSALNGGVFTIHTGEATPSALNLPLVSPGCWLTLGNSSESTPFWSKDPAVNTKDAPCQRSR